MLKCSHAKEVMTLIVFSRKLGDYLEKHNMKWGELIKSGIAVNTPQKFSHNRPVSTETINKICEYLQVQPSDIMEWIPDAEYEANQKKLEAQMQVQEKEKLEAQIAELQQKLNKL